MGAEQQMDIFSWVEVGKAQPKKPQKAKVKPAVVKPEPKKFTLKLKAGEVAYQCLECDEKPTVYDRIKPKIKCTKCGFYLEVIDEKIPQIKMEEKKLWL